MGYLEGWTYLISIKGKDGTTQATTPKPKIQIVKTIVKGSHHEI